MAITRSQQARQLYRIGGFGGRAKEGSVERPGGSSNRERGITQRGTGPGGTTGRIDRPQADPRPAFEMIGGERVNVGDTLGRQRALERSNVFQPPKRFQGIRSLASRFNPLSFLLGLVNPGLGIASRFFTQQAPETLQTFKDSPTLVDFFKNMRRDDDPSVFVDSGRGSGLRPTIDDIIIPKRKPINVVIDDDMSLIPRKNLNDYDGVTPFQRDVIEDTQDQADDPFLKGAMAELSQKQLDYLNSPKGKSDLKLLGPGGVFKNRLPLYEDKPFFGFDQEPTTPEEFNEYLDSIGAPKIKVADGGRIGAQEGGIMDLETGRQMYFLGKLVKKATRAVKKIVKSPVGRLGLFAAASAIPFGDKGSLFKRFMALDKGKQMLAGAGLLSAAPFIIGQEEEEQPAGFTGSVGGQIDPRAYTDPYGVLYGAFKAEGGSMKDEPVAKRTMPLLDMGGQEMDLRAEGGFVPIGRMEKADDVPARLSKNEFVFTADAVRNAGDGDVDKGAEVMYNMMKNLEAGGEVSEESQGLEGAREMFQTSKRLEDVL
tara:strand:+ start:1463 stop:3085 length:1623 start_codon:yes stop_codon:yes gene_type:complete